MKTRITLTALAVLLIAGGLHQYWQYHNSPVAAAKRFKQVEYEAVMASRRARGLPDFIPETKEEWHRFCAGWPTHNQCVVMQETGYPFLKRNMKGRCALEKRVREEPDTYTYRPSRTWLKYDEDIDQEAVCAAYGMNLGDKE